MILEGIVTTLGPDGGVNIAPMGPIVTDSMRELILRPFRTSTTYQNLQRTGQGVFHVTDDVLLLAQAAVGTPDPLPELLPAPVIDGYLLAGACRWYAFRVRQIDDQSERTTLNAEVVASGRPRDFWGFNRGKHAVLEAAILATRVGILPADQIQADMERLAVLVQKTGGPAEHQAFAFLSEYIHRHQRSSK